MSDQGSLPVQRRGCLPLRAHIRSGSAFTACAVAHALPRALLVLRTHRVFPSAPCRRGFGPSAAYAA